MPTPNNFDPTRLFTLRRRFVNEMTRRFDALSAAIRLLVIGENVFGITEPIGPMFVANTRWTFETNPEKVKKFRAWLKEQVDAGILSSSNPDKPWTGEFVESAYKTAVNRTYSETHDKMGASLGMTSKEFAAEAFDNRASVKQIKALYTRSYTGLKNVTKYMDKKMSETLARGFADGDGARKVASALVKDVGLAKTRALTVARTELTHAYAEGQLDGFEVLGVEDLGVLSEWLTTGDGKVCPLCASLNQSVYKIEDCRGLIPRHPNCRCSWIPNLDPKKMQAKQLAKTKKQVKESVALERPGLPQNEANALSRWKGADHPQSAPKRSQIIKAPAPTLFNEQPTAIIRWMHEDGWSYAEIKRVLEVRGVDVAEGTIKTQISRAKKGQAGAVLTPEQQNLLRGDRLKPVVTFTTTTTTTTTTKTPTTTSRPATTPVPTTLVWTTPIPPTTTSAPTTPPPVPSTDFKPIDSYGFRGKLSVDGNRVLTDVTNVKVQAFRVGPTNSSRSGAVFFGATAEDVAGYASLHPGYSIQEYNITLEKPVVAGHQHDLTRAWFRKDYGEMMDSYQRKYGKKGADVATAAFDKALNDEAKRRGYDGIIYMNPAPPAKTEIATFKKDAFKKVDSSTTRPPTTIPPTTTPKPPPVVIKPIVTVIVTTTAAPIIIKPSYTDVSKTGLIRQLAKEGYDFKEAKALLQELGIEVADGTIKKQLGDGRRGVGVDVNLSNDQLNYLRLRKGLAPLKPGSITPKVTATTTKSPIVKAVEKAVSPDGKPPHITHSGKVTDLHREIWAVLDGKPMSNHNQARHIGQIIEDHLKKGAKEKPDLAKVASLKEQIKGNSVLMEAWSKKRDELLAKVYEQVKGTPEYDAAKEAWRQHAVTAVPATWQLERALKDELKKGEPTREERLALIKTLRDFGHPDLKNEYRDDGFGKGSTAKKSSAVKAIHRQGDNLPADWGRDIREQSTFPVSVGHEKRGYRSTDGRKLVLSGSGSDMESTALHELVHAVEGSSHNSIYRRQPGTSPRVPKSIGTLQEEYKQDRVKNSTDPENRKRTTIYKGTNEVGYRDEFGDHYIGKDYSVPPWSQGDKHHEILSMGIEDLFHGRRGHTDNDQDYRQFVMGMLVGF